MSNPTSSVRLTNRLLKTAALYERLALLHVSDIVTLAGLFAPVLRSGRCLFAFGNGGSCAQAEHLVSELVGRFGRGVRRPVWNAVALGSNGAVLTAVANDFGYDQVFARQLAAHARPGDVALAFSTSGLSPNILAAMEFAHLHGVTTAAVVGPTPDPRLQALCQVLLKVPGDSVEEVQEGTLAVIHGLCTVIEELHVTHAEAS